MLTQNCQYLKLKTRRPRSNADEGRLAWDIIKTVGQGPSSPQEIYRCIYIYMLSRVLPFRMLKVQALQPVLCDIKGNCPHT